MKRDMDLVREILLAIEDSEHGGINQNPDIEGYTEEQIAYHAHLMGQAGLVEVADISSIDSLTPMAIAVALTWSGHEFIEASRKPEIWDEAKQVVSKAGGASFDIWKDVLAEIVKGSLGL